MLWSQLAQWPRDQVWPEAVRRHGRMTRYLDAREGDLTAWRFAKSMELMRAEERPDPTSEDLARAQGIREGIEEIDQVLRWMRNTDWPFR